MSYCEVLKTRLPLPANVPRAVIFLREVVKNGCTGRRNLQRRSSCKAVGALDVPLKRDRGGQRGKLKSDEVKWSNTREKKKGGGNATDELSRVWSLQAYDAELRERRPPSPSTRRKRCQKTFANFTSSPLSHFAESGSRAKRVHFAR